MANQVQSVNRSVPPNSREKTLLRSLRRMKPDLYRLATFRQWKINTQSHVSPALLSKVGFLYTGKGDKVRCEACELEIDSWKPAMDPRQEHMERRPDCPFVRAHNELFSNHDVSTTCLKSVITNKKVLNTDLRGLTDHGGGVITDTKVENRRSHFIYSLSTETIDRSRKYTLSNWPTITPSAQDMAYAGWWYTNIADRVICIYCDAMFHCWNEEDKPYEIHRLKSPQCFFVRTTEQRGINNSRETPVPNVPINDVPNGQNIVGAVHADYAMVFRRHQTFQNWPEAEPSSLPSIQSFVDAGFFYTGDKTIVRCFYCNGALRNWQATDDPKIEHARWFPQCLYIRQFIGENLYQAVQRKNRELRAQQNFQESSNDNCSQYVPWTDDEIDRMVKARLDLPVVEKLRQENHSMAIIRKVYEMQLRFKKDDFQSDVDLRVACLILDKQVKFINGNESNILIPQKWMQNYIQEQQQRSTETQKPETKQTLTSTKIVPTNTTTTVAIRPRVLPKKEEPMPCLLCLTTERQVACLPCGHLTSCVACGHSLKTCPICRGTVKAFVRIYT